jgi:polysaccharide export outer membrane protein
MMLSSAACSSAGSYVWVNDLPPDTLPTSNEYVIVAGDVVSVRVLSQDAMQTRARVRNDGRIELPIVGEIDVRGKRVSALRSELEARLKEFFNAPSVTVNVEEFQPLTIAVSGEVAHPGMVSLDPQSTVLSAIASAGGLTEYADEDRVFVLRTPGRSPTNAQPAPMRIRFTYEELSRGEGRSATFTLRPGDVVVVE